MTFINSTFYEEVNTGYDGDNGKDDGCIDPILYAIGLFPLLFINTSFYDGMHPVGHDDEHNQDAGR
jgi:hypothetical protein